MSCEHMDHFDMMRMVDQAIRRRVPFGSAFAICYLPEEKVYVVLVGDFFSGKDWISIPEDSTPKMWRDDVNSIVAYLERNQAKPNWDEELKGLK